ncbi:MAG: hypothetical protein IPM49_18540 [Flavobacteriales bacterium]|nr:hypothetical protein [Flavobacteriales bacterium]
MSPRDAKQEIKDYRPVLAVEARDSLMELAKALAFQVSRHGTYYGQPSVRDMLESLAEAYRADSGEVETALRAIGVVKPAENGT